MFGSPVGIRMQRPGEQPLQITVEDAVVIMSNQQKTIEELIKNNQKMYQYIQENAQGGSNTNYQFSQQNLPDPAKHLNTNTNEAKGVNTMSSSGRPMTLNEYLESKKTGAPAAAPTPAAAPAAVPAVPVTLSNYLASKTAATAATTAPATLAAAPTDTGKITLEQFLASKSAPAAPTVAPAATAPKNKSDPEVIDF
jgi:hypothetical protein